MTIRQIVYVSTASPKLSPTQLESLLAHARENNAKQGITGLLVYADGSIMQTLEGPPEVLANLIDVISADPRHKNILKILDIEADSRLFPDWQMAFARENSPEPIKNCIELFRLKKEYSDEMSLKGIVGVVMSGFIKRL